MPRTAEKVRTLVAEDPAMEDALESLLESEGETIEWRDVKGDLTSGQWGRLIEKGILEEAGDGFRLADPDAVREGLEGEGASGVSSSSDVDLPDDEETSWSKWDKGAALVAVGMFAGYSWAPARNAVGNVMDVFLGPLDSLLPFYLVIMVLAVITGLYSTLLQANLMNMEKMGAYQERMKDIQERQKQAKEQGNEEELERIREEQMEAMGDQLGMFKEQFRPMVWIMVLTIPVFLWMYWKLLAGHITTEEMTMVFPLVGEATLTAGIIGPVQAWIVWYFLCSMGFSQVIRKGLNIQTTPS
ncbi:DUF106 domain-containing protein [Halospeciosus flavus]|uniref:DUF106 domain-containing protein n=1 Tax=Halospeciosus flavus TaxID=3032283 RepID=A0ABD5Z1C7_9EURY|nr:DUF106 domain-containing protein [Halospeciosus flavus]